MSPPIFEKIAPDFKNNVFSYFASLRLRFLYFSYFCRFSVAPFPPLAQIGPICGRFWSHFCSVLVEVGERSRFLELFGTHAANKTHTHTHTTTPQPHNTTCNLVWHRTTDPFGSFLDPLWLFSCFSSLFSSQQPKQTNPQTHKPMDTKNLARRNARSRFESAAPSRGTKRARSESRTYRLQSLSRVRTLCRASPKIGVGKLLGLKCRIFSDFRSTFFFPKNRLNFGSPPIA